ncbi:hypothetical protein Tco_0097895 [Tanacetum coccineum]
MNTPSKEDLDNLFGPMFEEYFEKRSSDPPINSTTQPTQFHEDSPSTSSIIVEDHEAPPIETTSDEQTSPLSLTEADEFIQEASADFDGSLEFVSYNPPSDEEIEHEEALMIESFYHVARLSSSPTSIPPARPVRMFIAYAAHKNITIFQIVSKRFLNGHERGSSVLDFKSSISCGQFNSQSHYAIEATPMIKHYRRMIGGLMYLTASRPDIAYATFISTVPGFMTVQSSVTSSGDETSSGIVSEEEIDKKELEAHYGFMAKIQEVLPAESSSTDMPLEQVQNNDEKNVFGQ